MKLFLNSANMYQIEYALDHWNIDGITTDPCLIRDAGKPLNTTVGEICKLVERTNKTVSVAINPHVTDWEAMVDEAARVAAISPNIVVRLYCVEAAYQAVPVLARKGIRVDLALVFSAMQALQAMRSGAFYVSPSVSWQGQANEHARSFISEVVAIRNMYGYKALLAINDVSRVEHIVDAAVTGADIVAAAFDLYQEGFNSSYTRDTLIEYQTCWDTMELEG